MQTLLPIESEINSAKWNEFSFCERVIYQDSESKLFYADTELVSTKPFTDNQVISLFSGSGGLDLGLEMAGFDTAVCVEIDRDCRATLAFNRPRWNLLLGDGTSTPGDIKNITSAAILKASGLSKGEAALIVGGPPCQPFSNIGKKKGIDDPVNGILYSHYLRIVKECLPKAFIFENVEGFRQGKHQTILNDIVNELSSVGYSISHTILNSADYGVPQQRKRFIMIGIKDYEHSVFPLPTHLQSVIALEGFYKHVKGKIFKEFRPWTTVGQAFSNIPPELKFRSDYALMNISPKVQHRMTYIEQGQNFKVLPLELRPNCWKNGLHQGHDTFGRLREDRPSVTIRTAAYNPAKGMYIHPKENRGLSSHEMAALQSFPSNWEFKCDGSQKVTLVSVGKQIGNAVPPLLAKALGLAIKAVITN